MNVALKPQTTETPMRMGAAWWCAPDLLMLALIIPLAILCLISAESLLRSNGAHSYVTFGNGIGIVALLLVYVCGAFFGRKTHFPSLAAARVPDLYMDLLFWLTLTAYIIWFTPLIRHPDFLVAVLAGVQDAVYNARESLQTTPGLTTFTQAGVAYVCLFVGRPERESLKRRHVYFLAIIIGLGVLRAFLRSERLGILELIIPLALAYAMRHRHSRLIAIAPFAGLFGLYAFFALTEYFRSWTNLYSKHGDSLAVFVLDRIQKYYVYSLNNGLGLLDSQAGGTHSEHLFFSLEWLYKFPVIGPLITNSFQVTDPTQPFLHRFADPELNSFAQVIDLICDFGWFGAGIIMLLIGIFSGIAYHSMVKREGVSRFYYPVFFIGLLEILRIHYLSTGRTFPIYFLLIAPFLFTKRQSLAFRYSEGRT